MTMKRILICGILAVAAWVVPPANADSSSDHRTSPPTQRAIRLRILQPASGTSWYFSSKQVIEWSISGLPSGEYLLVAYLKRLRDGKKGMIVEEPAGNGKAQVNYVVNEIGYGEEIYPLKNGNYAFSLAIYRKPGAGKKGLGESVLEKSGGIIRIKGSDAGTRRHYGPIPDDRAKP